MPAHSRHQGQIYLLSSAPSGKTSDGQRVTRIDLASGQLSVIYETNEPYSMDPEQPRVAGYLSSSDEVVLRAWNGDSHAAFLFAQGRTGEKRVLAKFTDKWIADVSSLGFGLGVILAEERPHVTWTIQGTEAVLVQPDGSITPILRNDRLGIASGVTCSKEGECVLTINVEPCTEEECSNALISVSNGHERMIDGLVGKNPHISPTGRWLAAVKIDDNGPSQYQIFDLEKNAWHSDLGLRPVGGAAWSPDGKMFAHSSGIGPPKWTLRIWEVDGAEVASFEVAYRSQVLAFGSK